MNSVGTVIQAPPAGNNAAQKGKRAVDEIEGSQSFQQLMQANDKENPALATIIEEPVQTGEEQTGLTLEELPDEIQAGLSELDGGNLEDLYTQLKDLLQGLDLTETEMGELADILSQAGEALKDILDALELTDEGAEASVDSIAAQLLAFLGQQSKADSEQPTAIAHTLQLAGITAIDNPQAIMVDGDKLEKLEKNLMEIMNKVNEILGNLQGNKEISKAAPKLLELMQQWQQLAKNASTPEQAAMLKNVVQNAGEGGKVWSQLLQNFQNREHFAGRKFYNTDAKVTSADVAKWLTKALEGGNGQGTALGEGERPGNTQATMNAAMPMSRVEQYAIYINQSPQATSQTSSADTQLIEQFQKIMAQSKLTSFANGNSQLSIQLRPNNLGDMMVRFTQINGEMTVKILVSSAAAKEMLESNVSQLKSMFSPHQVVIEKQETTIQTNATQQETDEQFDEQTESQSGDRDDQQQDNTQEFSLDFEEILNNEKG